MKLSLDNSITKKLRMLPPAMVTIPLFVMYRQVTLHAAHIGMILLYTIFDLSFSVWLLS